MKTYQDVIDRHGRSEIAKRLNVRYSATYKWDRRVPAERAVQLAKEFGVPLWGLRPDLWQPPS